MKKLEGVRQYLLVQIGSEQYGIDISYVDNVVRMQKITRVPKSQNYYKGMINLRGEAIAVMSARLKMGLEEEVYTEDSRIVVLSVKERGTVGMIVDGVKEILELPEEERMGQALKNKKNRFVAGTGKYGEKEIFLLDIKAVTEESE